MHLFLSVVVVVTTTPRCRRDLYAFPTDFAPPSTTKTAPGRARLLRPTPENRKRKNRLSRGKRNFQKLQKECSHPRRRSFRTDSKPRWWGGAQESRRKRVATARTGLDGAKGLHPGSNTRTVQRCRHYKKSEVCPVSPGRCATIE